KIHECKLFQVKGVAVVVITELEVKHLQSAARQIAFGRILLVMRGGPRGKFFKVGVVGKPVSQAEPTGVVAEMRRNNTVTPERRCRGSTIDDGFPVPEQGTVPQE